jgi:hypothetical protein
MENKYDIFAKKIKFLIEAKPKNQSSFLTVTCQRGMNISSAL